MGCVHGKCCLPRRGDAADGGVAGGAVLGHAAVPGAGLVLEFATLTLAGHYPESPERESQDALLVSTRFAGDPDLHLFAVFDGHGASGSACAAFARDSLPSLLAADPHHLITSPAAAFRDALLATNAALHAAPDVDDSMSGTTAVAALVAGGALHVANVGDSRAVAGVWRGGRVAAEELSWDQTPFRDDERERVKACGARVMSVEQVEGARDPAAESWEAEEGDPPRVWARDGLYPGTAFTRSLGDAAAETVGVIAEPEVKSVDITPSHMFFVVASDGVFEFLSSQSVVDRVSMHPDPRDACSAIAAESYKLWLEHENRTDDITIIVVHIKDSCNSGPAGSDQLTHSSTEAPTSLDTVRAARSVSRPPEGSHPNGGAATELQSSSSESPTEQSLSCVAPSPTHPSFIGNKALEASERVQGKRFVLRSLEACQPKEDTTALQSPTVQSLSQGLSSTSIKKAASSPSYFSYGTVTTLILHKLQDLGIFARVFLEHLLTMPRLG